MRLAVLGSPVAHSRSPRIHAAAYRVLGLAWTYEAIEQRPETLGAFLDELDATWRGLSVTAPLKEEAASWASRADDLVAITGAANTLRVDEQAAWNTDVAGVLGAFESVGVTHARRAVVLGAGATAVSSLVALARMGAETVEVRLRDARKGDRLRALGARLGVAVRLEALDGPIGHADVAVSTLPAAADVTPRFDAPPLALLDADYASGAGRFASLETRVVDGLEMLLHQALAQVRIFVHGDPDARLEREPEVWRAMRDAV